MTYRLSMAVDDNICLEIENQTFDGLNAEWVSLGGDPDWLLNTVKASVAASLHGERVRILTRSLGGKVLSDEGTEPPGEPAPTSQPPQADPFSESSPTASLVPEPIPVAAPTTPTAVPSDDPWADEAVNTETSAAIEKDKEWPGEASVVRSALMSNKPPPVDPWGAPAASQPANVPAQNLVTTTDNFDREWTTGHRDAPMCHCNPPKPAAHMSAVSQNTGNNYTKWRCAKAAGSDWKSKCDLDIFTD